MNSTEHDLWTALKGLGALGLLRLLWAGAVKLATWFPGYTNGRRTQEIESAKVIQTAKDSESDRLLKMQDGLDRNMLAFVTKLSERVDEQDGKIELLEKRLMHEEEARKLAGISAEVAHMRADEMDKQRSAALAEVAELRQQNNNLRVLLDDADRARVADRLEIEKLTARIESNNQHIRRMERQLADFESGTFEMTRIPREEPGNV